ncbi:MAG: hypothetical protein R3B13_26850 [Polyangiaceae bacterium]
MNAWGWSLLGAIALTGTVACAPQTPRASFDYHLPPFSARLGHANFEYVKFGAIGRVSIPARREHMKRSMEIGLVNEALRQIRAQAPTGEPTALVNVVVIVTDRTVTKQALFTSTSSERQDLELIVRADIVRFTSPTAPPREE